MNRIIRLHVLVATGFLLAIAPRVAGADCNGIVGVDCVEHTGEGSKGSFFRITIPTSPVWNGDVVIVNHGFDLDPLSINPHNRCRLSPGVACDVDADCVSGTGPCNKISYLGLDAGLLPQGIAVAASTYSQTGWSVFQSRKDISDILKFMEKTPAIGEPARVIITGFSMGGAVTVDASLRINPKEIAGVVPLCPASGGGLPTWDAAHDLRLTYDYLCSGVPGAAFFSETDAGDAISQTSMALRVNTCLGILFPSSDPDEALAQAARLAQMRTLIGHTGTDFEVIVLMGFATNAMYDLVQPKGKLSGKRYGMNEGIVYDVDAGLEAGIERVPAGPGRKKLSKNTLIDYTKGKGGKLAYPIVHLANTDDFLTIPGFQRVLTNALNDGQKSFTSAYVNAGGHCNFTTEEVTATLNLFFDWLDGGPQPTDADIEDECLALSAGNPAVCRFSIGFVPPPLSDRVPPRPDWPAAAQ
jgi:hypothetical protein